MHRRYNLAHLILAGVIVLGLTPLMVTVDARARIAFESDRDGHIIDNSWAYEIYVMDADGGNQRNLTNNPANDRSRSWSPDGKRIAFVSERDEHPHFIPGLFASEIYVMDANGKNQQNLTNNPADDGYPSWSPDGKQIIFQSNRDELQYEIYVMDADGGNQQKLTENPNNEDEYPSWSPDGQQIVFVSAKDGHFGYEIYVMDADGGNLQRLTENLKHEWDPVWSPDGKRIAFSLDRKGDGVNFEIYVMDADGANQRRLTENRSDDVSPSWSPDGERIAFTSERDGNMEIYVTDADGTNQQNLTNNPHDDYCPSWFNSPFSVSPAGKKFTMWGRLKQVDR